VLNLPQRHKKADKSGMNDSPLSFEPEPSIPIDRKEAGIVRKSNEELFSLLLASVKDYAIFVIDPQGYVVTWNEGAKRIKGYESSEIIGKHFSVFYPEERVQDGFPQKELEIAKQQGRYEEESWRLRKNGTAFWANVVITAIFDKDGNHVGFAKVTRDLTERREREQERDKLAQTLAASNEELQQIAYRVSHELQAPVATILSYSKLLSVRYNENLGPDADDFMGKMTEASKLIARMIDDLWTYARVSKLGQAQEDVDLNDVLTGVIEEYNTNADINILSKNKLPVVRGNNKQLTFLLKELIQNAIRYKGSVPPLIEINAGKKENGWLFSFKDNGQGIEKVAAGDIFKVFHRLKGNPEASATGMGLAICKKIVSQLGGRIWFESEAGQGSTFLIWLPDYREVKK
jgi:PAS domain S-box-containing protein